MRDGARTGLIGRRAERPSSTAPARAGQEDGHSGVVVVRGEAGIGKTELLNHLVGRADGFRVVRAAGVQSEMELSYAGLHQLCAPLLSHLDDLPGPQRTALRTAFGMRAGDAPDRFLVGLATLSLLAAAADEPLLCVVDDAQWLDRVSSQTLEFVARRLPSSPNRCCWSSAVRESGPRETLATLPELFVHGLDEQDSALLLDSVVTGPLDPLARDRIVAETRGNPLALLELPRGLTAMEMAGGFDGPAARPLAGQIEAGYLRRIQALPAEAQRLLLVAALEPVGDVALLRRAAERLGIRWTAPSRRPRHRASLTLGTSVRFRHLVRSAAHYAADVEDAAACTGRWRIDRRGPLTLDAGCGTLASAATELPTSRRRELEGSAGRAHRRGGLAAAAAFLHRPAS
ncbi:AAA family ATPase [Streptomyces sp. KL116D]|uniref:AAA family ATPase n=1 Tax=Streptomyces sp. KL116D TaxID=3045152 RepID=UPI003558ABCA